MFLVILGYYEVLNTVTECKTSTPLFLFGNVTRVLFIILFNLIFCKMKKISKISLHQLDRAELSKKQ